MTTKIKNAVEKHRALILETERHIWNNPETGYKEWKTHAYLFEAFEKLGYTPIAAGDIPGFYADLNTGRPGPMVCVMGELDSLVCMDHPECDPETGAVHACGHHAQCAGLLGVAAALKEPGMLDDFCGTIRLMAVPAEELIELEYRQNLRKEGRIHYLGGKVEFLYRGYFDGVDVALMLHTSGGSGLVVTTGGNGCLVKNIEFKGFATHASSPNNAINALYAANLGMNAINALRETFVDSEHTRVHPIVTSGGTVVNAIPSSVTMESYVRGASMEGIARENKKVNRALAASAAAMGANVHLIDFSGYSPLHNDPLMSQQLVKAYQEIEGEEKAVLRNSWDLGCTDMGDISSVIPSVQGFIGGAGGVCHGNDYHIADPETACVGAAKAQTMMLWYLLRNEGALVQEIKENADLVYPDYASYFAAVDALAIDRDLVEYSDDGAMLRY